jgi:hypothetical protein
MSILAVAVAAVLLLLGGAGMLPILLISALAAVALFGVGAAVGR